VNAGVTIAAVQPFLRRHPLAVYFAGAYALTWSVWIPLAASGARVDFGSAATHVPGLFGPAPAALLITAATSGANGVGRLLLSCISFRGGLRWLAFAVLSPLAAFAVAALFTGVPPLSGLGEFAGFPEAGVLPLWFMLLLAAYGEEIGWRGFALPRLQRTRSALGATVLLACAWAGWHAPAFVLLAAWAGMTPGAMAGFFLGMLGGAFVLTWLYNRTGGSVLLAALWHASFNLVTGSRAGRGAMAAAVSTAAMLFGFALAALDVRARKRGGRAVLG